MAYQNPRYSIVIPAFNEQDNIPLLAEELRSVAETFLKDFEVIFVNDGSTDATEQVLIGLEKKYSFLRHLTFPENRGQTSAFQAGFRAAQGAYVITMDCDLQNDPADIPRLLAKIESCDCVCGVRIKRQDNLLRRVSSVVANTIRNVMTGDHITDVGCSLRIIKTDALRSVPLFNGLHRFLPTLLRWNGYVVCEVPVSHRPRTKGVSKYNVRNRLFKSLVDLCVVMWMKKNWIRSKT